MGLSRIFGFISLFLAALLLVITLIAYATRSDDNLATIKTIPYASQNMVCHPSDEGFQEVSCQTDLDCNAVCLNGKGSCVTTYIIKNGDRQEGMKPKKICLSSMPDVTPGPDFCDPKKGGMLTYSSDNDQMYWGCMCAYPEVYSGETCSDLVPGFCNGGEIKKKDGKPWDATSGPPESVVGGICQCPEGKDLMISSEGKPFCTTSSKLNFMGQSGFYPCSSNKNPKSAVNVFCEPPSYSPDTPPTLLQ